MRKIIEVEDHQGLDSLLGESVLIFCSNYFYAGKLTGVNDSCVELTDASIVYETGSFSDKGYKDAQKLPGKTWFIARSAIESFGAGK